MLTKHNYHLKPQNYTTLSLNIINSKMLWWRLSRLIVTFLFFIFFCCRSGIFSFHFILVYIDKIFELRYHKMQQFKILIMKIIFKEVNYCFIDISDCLIYQAFAFLLNKSCFLEKILDDYFSYIVPSSFHKMHCCQKSHTDQFIFNFSKERGGQIN